MPPPPPCTPEMVAELASRPAVAKALKSPFSPESVLTFFFGMDVKEEESKKILKDGSSVMKDLTFWMRGHDDYDELCKTFIPVIREAAAADSKNKDSVWSDGTTSTSVKAAKLILFDQLTRNCFRRQSEAFAYDDMGFQVGRELAQLYLDDDDDDNGSSSSCTTTTNGDFYDGAYVFLINVCLGHSEELDDHKVTYKILDKIIEASKAANNDAALELFQMQYGKAKEHTEVIEQFGRYPHRNHIFGRETTKEEEEWLARPDIPGWAKSQMKIEKKEASDNDKNNKREAPEDAAVVSPNSKRQKVEEEKKEAEPVPWGAQWVELLKGGQNQRWRINDEDCHKKALSHFQRFVKGDPADVHVYCPLAGDDPFVYLLFETGYSVTAIDIVPVAIEELKKRFTSSEDEWTKEERDNTIIWKHASGRATLLIGDAMQKRPDLEGKFDAVYDKDGFGALPKDLRDDFCLRTAEFTKTGGIVYLECKLNGKHDEVKHRGPPYSLKGEDLMAENYYGGSFDYVEDLGSVYPLTVAMLAKMQQTGHILKKKE